MTSNLTCSIVVPARNEKGTIEKLVEMIPSLGALTEIIFVEGHSCDGTRQEIERVMTLFPYRNIKLVRQDDHFGKSDALRRGFACAKGDIVIILDADLTVATRELPLFFDSLVKGKACFANGSRLLTPMERGAMPLLNLLANKFFAKLLSWIMGRPISDALCGMKGFGREDYMKMHGERDFFEGDPFGDFSLLFGAKRAGLKIIEIPVTYLPRIYGKSNICHWRDGMILLRKCWAGFLEFKLGLR